MNKKICFIFSAFPPISMGGVQRYLMNIAYGLNKLSFDSTIVTRYYPPLPRKEKDNHYSILRVGFNPMPYSHNKLLGMAQAKLGDIFTYTVLGQYHAIPCARNSLIIHSQYAIESDIELGRRLALRTQKPHVITLHTRFGNQAEDVKPTKNLIRKLREASYVIVNRRSSFRYLREQGLDNICEMGNPVPTKSYIRPPQYLNSEEIPTRFLFIGRLVERRGAHIAIQAFHELSRRNKNSELWIVGSGPLENTLRTYVKKNGLSNRIFFFGNRVDVREYLWQSNVFLATSSIANSPSIALREAMTAGLAIVATDVEDTKSIVEHEKAGLISSCSIQEISRKMLSLAENQELTRRYGIEAQKQAIENFDIMKYVQRLSSIYQDISEKGI